VEQTKEVQKEIVFYAKKLSPFKQIEALDFIKWLYGGPSKEDNYTSEEIKKIKTLVSKKGGEKFKNWEDAKEYLKSLAN